MRLRISFESQVLQNLCIDLADGVISTETATVALNKALTIAYDDGQIHIRKPLLRNAFTNVAIAKDDIRQIVTADMNEQVVTSCGQKRDGFPTWLQHILLSVAEGISSSGHPIPESAIQVQPA